MEDQIALRTSIYQSMQFRFFSFFHGTPNRLFVIKKGSERQLGNFI
jgi:hypothetical protein